jgi:hypothetical protein
VTQQNVDHLPEVGKTTEMFAQVIAGPETAARLGIPVGTVLEGRHVVLHPDGRQTGGEPLTGEEINRRLDASTSNTEE